MIPITSLPSLCRSVGPLSSTAPFSGGVERGAQLSDGRELYSRSSMSHRFYVPAAILPPRVSLLFQISGDIGGSNGFSSGLGGRLVVLLILVIGLELLGLPLCGFLCWVDDLVADGGFGYQEVVCGRSMDVLLGFGGGLLSQSRGSGSSFPSLQGLVWRWPTSIHWCSCVFGGSKRWLMRQDPRSGAF
jgi:hypothetical protein